MHIDTEAYVLRRFDFSESSQIGHFLTPDLGRVAGLAKGIKKASLTLKGPMDLFHRARVRFVRRAGSDLLLVVRYEPTTIHPRLRDDAARMFAAFFATEVVYDGTREDHADPELFDLLGETLEALEDAKPSSVLLTTVAFELKFLARSGFRPALGTCARCGQKCSARPIVLYPLEGGTICDECRSPGMAGVKIEGGLLAALDGLMRHPFPFASRLRASGDQIRKLARMTHTLIETVLERSQKSRRFLEILPTEPVRREQRVRSSS